MTSPRSVERSTVEVNEFIETYLAKNSCMTMPNMNVPIPSKAVSSQVKVISTPRPKVIGPLVGIRPVIGLERIDLTPSICR